MFIGWYFEINVLFLIMFKVFEFSGIFVSLGGLDKIFSDLVGDRRGGSVGTQAGTMMLSLNISLWTIWSRFIFTSMARKWIWDLLRVCECVLGTRMKENNTSYISNSQLSSQKNLNKKARGLAGTLASYKNKKWQYSV